MKKPKTYKPKKTTAKKFSLKEQKTTTQKGYDKQWQKYRARFLHYNPKCYCCGAKSKVVDHIRAHKGDESLFKNTHNHMPLCEYCHNFITGRFDRQDPPKTEEKCRWLKQRRDELKINVTIKVLGSY